MEQKRVSFAVAKAIKEAGYPQNYGEGSLYYSEDGQLYEYSSELSPIYPDVCYVCATYLSVWLWLWRNKKIRIEFGDMTYKIYDATEWADNYGYHLIDLNNNPIPDPEEAIIAAVESLVDNKLLK